MKNLFTDETLFSAFLKEYIYHHIMMYRFICFVWFDVFLCSKVLVQTNGLFYLNKIFLLCKYLIINFFCIKKGLSGLC